MFNRELIGLGLCEDDAEAAIRYLGSLLEAQDFVTGDFIDAVIKREGEFPTGLPTVAIGVAIPHTDSAHVKRSAVALGVLDKPVLFQQMGDPVSSIAVRIIFLLAIKDPGKVVPFLQKICTAIQDQAFLETVSQSRDPDQLAGILKEKIGLE